MFYHIAGLTYTQIDVVHVYSAEITFCEAFLEDYKDLLERRKGLLNVDLKISYIMKEHTVIFFALSYNYLGDDPAEVIEEILRC